MDADLRPSASGDIGRVAASGDGPGLAHGGENQDIWIAVGALARGALRVAGPVAVELGLGAQVPVARYTFEFKQNVEAYPMARVGFFGTASLWVGLD